MPASVTAPMTEYAQAYFDYQWGAPWLNVYDYLKISARIDASPKPPVE
jgi:hypothetical protein